MKKYVIWLSGGYTGGHTSQAGWDTSVEIKAESRINKLLPTIHTDSWGNEGNTSGYYPSVSIWCTPEELALVKANLHNIKSIDVK